MMHRRVTQAAASSTGLATAMATVTRRQSAAAGYSREAELEAERAARLVAMKSRWMPQLPALTNFAYGKFASTWKAPGAQQMNDPTSAGQYSSTKSSSTSDGANSSSGGGSSGGTNSSFFTGNNSNTSGGGGGSNGGGKFAEATMLGTCAVLTYLMAKIAYRRYTGDDNEMLPIWLVSDDIKARYYLYIAGTDANTRTLIDAEYLRSKAQYPGVTFFDWLAIRFPQNTGIGHKYSGQEAFQRVLAAVKHDGSFMGMQAASRRIAYTMNQVSRGAALPAADRVDVFIDNLGMGAVGSAARGAQTMLGFGGGSGAPPANGMTGQPPLPRGGMPMYVPPGFAPPQQQMQPAPPGMAGGGGWPPPQMPFDPMMVGGGGGVDMNMGNSGTGLAPSYTLNDVLNAAQQQGSHGSNPFGQQQQAPPRGM